MCQTCPECQRDIVKRPTKVPMIPLPVISEPFQQIAMDIVGPLPRTQSSNKYMLVVFDYGTRYPEAVPLCCIDAATIAEELLRMFACVGIPKEIFTDQGSNFTLQLLKELYCLLKVKGICTSPYHPETDSILILYSCGY